MNQTTEPTESNGTRKATMGKDATVIIFTMTILGFAIAFVFDDGYLTYFGIPVIFADVTLHSLFLCGSAAFGIVVSLLLLLNFLVTIFPGELSSYVFRRIAEVVLIVVATAIGAWLAGALRGLWAIGLFLSLSYAFFELIMPLLWFPQKATYAEKLLEQQRADRFSKRQLGARLKQYVPPFYGYGLLLGIFLLFYAYNIGVYVARTQDEFAIADGNSRCAVLRVRAEGFLCAEFDEMSHSLIGVFRFVDPQETTLKISKVGPLAKFDPFSVAEPPKLP